jgi:hypothetical protein
MKLFVQFTDFLIFKEVYLCKDRDEIINHMVYCLRLLKAQELDPYHQEQPNDERSENRGSGYINSPVYGQQQQSSPTYDEYRRPFSNSFTEDYESEFIYQPTAQIGYYEFQVFGVDSRGRFYPHILGLYSRFIRHYDEHRRPFSQHNYSDIKGEVQYFEQSSRLVIPYENDNLYTCIVSDKDRTILLLLLRGRNQIYQSLSFDVDDSKKPDLDENKLLNISDFPTKFSYVGQHGVTQSLAGHDQYQYMLGDEENQMGMNLPENMEGGFLDPVRQIEKGIRLMKHVKGLLGAGIQERIFAAKLVKEPEVQVLVSWGKSKDKYNHCHNIVGIITGDNARMFVNSSKIRPYQLQNYSFILMTARTGKFSSPQDVYVVAKDIEGYQAWTLGIRKLLQLKQNLIPQQLSAPLIQIR